MNRQPSFTDRRNALEDHSYHHQHYHHHHHHHHNQYNNFATTTNIPLHESPSRREQRVEFRGADSPPLCCTSYSDEDDFRYNDATVLETRQHEEITFYNNDGVYDILNDNRRSPAQVPSSMLLPPAPAEAMTMDFGIECDDGRHVDISNLLSDDDLLWSLRVSYDQALEQQQQRGEQDYYHADINYDEHERHPVHYQRCQHQYEAQRRRELDSICYPTKHDIETAIASITPPAITDEGADKLLARTTKRSRKVSAASRIAGHHASHGGIDQQRRRDSGSCSSSSVSSSHRGCRLRSATRRTSLLKSMQSSSKTLSSLSSCGSFRAQAPPIDKKKAPPPPSYAPAPATSTKKQQQPRNKNSPSKQQQQQQPCSSESSSFPNVQVEISPGIFERLRGSKETWNAYCNGNVRPIDCLCCELELYCVSDANYVICPDCKSISPTCFQPQHQQEVASHCHNDGAVVGGVGLGLPDRDVSKDTEQQQIQQRRIHLQQARQGTLRL